MIIIRKILSLFIVLVVITSFSFTVFAAGEQPSGSSYTYISSTGSSATSTYWTAVTESIYRVGQWLKPLKDSTFRYFDGTSTASTNNFFTALANSLYYIGANVKTNFSSIISDTGTIASRISTTNTTLATISGEKLPTQSGYSYDNNSGPVSNQTYWSATSNQLTFIFRRLATINSNIEDIESNIQDYSTQLNSINSNTTSIKSSTSSTAINTSSIATSTSSIDGKMPDGYYGYVNSTGTIVNKANSTYDFWRAISNDLAYSGQQTFQINSKLPIGYYSYMGANDRVSKANSTYDFWEAVSQSLSLIGTDIQDLKVMFADNNDLQAKRNQRDNETLVFSDFVNGTDTSTSIGIGSIGKVKDLGDNAATWFDTGVQATSLFDALSNIDNDGPWMWFTQATMDDLDSTSSIRSFKSSPSPGEYVPDLYGAKMDELDRLLNAFSE